MTFQKYVEQVIFSDISIVILLIITFFRNLTHHKLSIRVTFLLQKDEKMNINDYLDFSN